MPKQKIIQKNYKATRYLIYINGVIFVLTVLLNRFFGINIVDYFALYYPISQKFEPYQLITYMFLHGGLLHISLNMFVLWMFGIILESVWGTGKFLFYYFFTGIGAILIHILIQTFTIQNLEDKVMNYINDPSYSKFNKIVNEEIGDISPQMANRVPVYQKIKKIKKTWPEDEQLPYYIDSSKKLLYNYYQLQLNKPTVGASGAVYGLLLAFGILFPNIPLYIFFFFPVRAKYVVVILAMSQLMIGVFGMGSNVANFAHLGGMLFGFLLIKVWGEKPLTLRRDL